LIGNGNELFDKHGNNFLLSGVKKFP